jgi:NAD(P) transhydrogenase subunit alpha
MDGATSGAASSTVGIVMETLPGERRVALTPAAGQTLLSSGCHVLVEAGAGAAAGYPDERYRERGITVAARAEVLAADVLAVVRLGGLDPAAVHPGQILVGLADPLGAPKDVLAMAERGARVLALELLPRITRTQPMDVLSSQATVAGYKAALLAAAALPRLLPLLMTAAGTITPARVLVLGAGVAGLQAIATARRLGAVVEAYDVRSAVREQVESLGARFVDLGLDTADAEGAGGYARELGEDFYRRQRDALGRVVAGANAVITTAQVPGGRAPVLVTAGMVANMASGSVIVDLAAGQGGNCELSRPDEQVVTPGGVTILGPTNLPATVATDASAMYGRNVAAFLGHLLHGGRVALDRSDEIVAGTLVADSGEVCHARVRAALGLDVKEAMA